MSMPIAFLGQQKLRVSHQRPDSLHSSTRGAAGTWIRAAQPPAAATSSSDKKKLAVFVSGGGSNFKTIHAATLDGRINADVQVCPSKG